MPSTTHPPARPPARPPSAHTLPHCLARRFQVRQGTPVVTCAGPHHTSYLALQVISHDRPFCEALSATHVAYVIDGGVQIEERTLRDSDWVAATTVALEDEVTDAAVAAAATSPSSAAVSSPTAAPVDPEARRRASKAPGQIKKLEAKIADAEGKMATIDAEMMEKGSDVDFLKEATTKREDLQAKVDGWYEEYEQLEMLLEQFPDVKR